MADVWGRAFAGNDAVSAVSRRDEGADTRILFAICTRLAQLVQAPRAGATVTSRKPQLAANFCHERLAGGDGRFFWPVFKDLSFEWLRCPKQPPGTKLSNLQSRSAVLPDREEIRRTRQGRDGTIGGDRTRCDAVRQRRLSTSVGRTADGKTLLFGTNRFEQAIA